ncbi:MAG: hypothetical protein ACRDRU_05930 [Pseudonocardiaceae bacterium]
MGYGQAGGLPVTADIQPPPGQRRLALAADLRALGHDDEANRLEERVLSG